MLHTTVQERSSHLCSYANNGFLNILSVSAFTFLFISIGWLFSLLHVYLLSRGTLEGNERNIFLNMLRISFSDLIFTADAKANNEYTEIMTIMCYKANL